MSLRHYYQEKEFIFGEDGSHFETTSNATYTPKEMRVRAPATFSSATKNKSHEFITVGYVDYGGDGRLNSSDSSNTTTTTTSTSTSTTMVSVHKSTYVPIEKRPSSLTTSAGVNTKQKVIENAFKDNVTLGEDQISYKSTTHAQHSQNPYRQLRQHQQLPFAGECSAMLPPAVRSTPSASTPSMSMPAPLMMSTTRWIAENNNYNHLEQRRRRNNNNNNNNTNSNQFINTNLTRDFNIVTGEPVTTVVAASATSTTSSSSSLGSSSPSNFHRVSRNRTRVEKEVAAFGANTFTRKVDIVANRRKDFI